MTPTIYLIIYLGLTVFFYLVALIAYFRDKKLAVKGKERTKEKTLLFFAFLQVNYRKNTTRMKIKAFGEREEMPLHAVKNFESELNLAS